MKNPSPRTMASPLVVLLCLAGCDTRKDTDTSRPANFGFQASLGQSLIEEGRVNYARYCVGCHGDVGDGNGQAALFLNPKPRNFVNGIFKFSSTRSGQLPTDEDLKRTIRNGLRGSAMPSFALLPDRTLDALVAYIKTLSPKWKEREPAPRIPFVTDPFKREEDRAKAIARGEAVYHGYSICWSCHPSYVAEDKINEYIKSFGAPAREGFRPNMHQSEGKPNEEGEMVYPPDFKRDFVRSGAKVEDLYRSIAAGISGTAMPTWAESIELPGKKPGDPPLASQQDLWAMAYYVQSLLAQRPALLTPGQFALRDRPRPIYLHGAPPPSAQPTTPATSQPAKLDEEF